jgi:predicted nucleotidyltransferase
VYGWANHAVSRADRRVQEQRELSPELAERTGRVSGAIDPSESGDTSGGWGRYLHRRREGTKSHRTHACPCPGREEVLEDLRELKPDPVEEFGMRSLSVFGSYARAEHEAESDIDLLVEFEQVPSLFGMSRLQAQIEERIGVSVDLVTPGGLRRRTLARARDEAVAV